MNKDELREKLSEEAYKVTQEGATEAPFTGEYYENKKDGMYHCIICDAPLFDAKTKFDSRSGWPSFYDQASEAAVTFRQDESAEMMRTEVACKACGAHLGHIFDDAPETPTGKRFCINSCALSFDERKEDQKTE